MGTKSELTGEYRDEEIKIQGRIHRDRSDIDDTLNKIADKFSFSRAKDMLWKELGYIGRAPSSVKGINVSILEKIKDNPIPAAMTGIGLYLLLTSRNNGRTTEKAGEISNEISEKAEGAKAAIHEKAGMIKEKAGYYGGKASEKAGKARTLFGEYLESNPLGILAIAFGIGAAIGLSVPGTKLESETIGEAGKKAVHAAEEEIKKAA